MTTYPPPRKNRLPLVLGGVAVVLLLCVGAGLLGSLLGDGKDADAVNKPAAVAGAGAKAPTPADVKLTAKITEKTCYGEAGCAVTWVPVVTYIGPEAADREWTIAYEVAGVESGTTVGKIVMRGSAPVKQSDKHARVAARGSKITLKVTGVDVS